MSSETLNYNTVIIDERMVTFVPQNFPRGSIPKRGRDVLNWEKTIGTIVDGYSSNQDKWDLVKPWYYGGLAVMAGVHFSHMLTELRALKVGGILQRLPLRMGENTKYLLSMTSLVDDCLTKSINQVNLMKPPYLGLDNEVQGRIMGRLDYIHEQLGVYDKEGRVVPAAMRLQSGLGTALDHIAAVSYNAPFVWSQHYGFMPRVGDLENVLANTFRHVLHPLSQSHMIALIALELDNGVNRGRYEEAQYLLQLDSHGQPYLDFVHQPPTLNGQNLQSLADQHHTVHSPNMGCPARLSVFGRSSIHQLMELMVLKVGELYGKVYAGR